MYSLAIHFYAFIIALISPFHKKARIMRLGQWKTNSILREKIDRNAKYIWFHASSLGEFEQGFYSWVTSCMFKFKVLFSHTAA